MSNGIDIPLSAEERAAALPCRRCKAPRLEGRAFCDTHAHVYAEEASALVRDPYDPLYNLIKIIRFTPGAIVYANVGKSQVVADRPKRTERLSVGLPDGSTLSCLMTPGGACGAVRTFPEVSGEEVPDIYFKVTIRRTSEPEDPVVP